MKRKNDLFYMYELLFLILYEISKNIIISDKT